MDKRIEYAKTVIRNMGIRFAEAKVNVSIHRKKHKGKTYEWVVRWITVPKSLGSVEKVYVIPEDDFIKLASILYRMYTLTTLLEK